MCSAAEPIIIIGAPRSGTNMLRDVLTRIPGLATWPCDEINYIWRHGNVRYPSDAIPPERATTAVKAYIRRCFEAQARRSGNARIVEKTCANALRVEFVDSVFPEARYIYIHRDALDAVGSAMKRWKAKLEPAYIARKARFVPVSDLPYYAARYAWNRLYRLITREKRLAFWGPQIDGMPELLQRYELDELCALQWQACTRSAHRSFDSMNKNRWIEVAYEDFVADPEEALQRILAFLGVDAAPDVRRQAVADVSTRSVGKGRRDLGPVRAARIERLLGDDMRPNHAAVRAG